MLRRLEYLLFIVCVILAAIFAPRFMFALQDRANNQTVYAEYKEMNISSVLVSNYIEDDAERYTTYLYRKSQGTEYEAMELEGSLDNGEILVLLQEALSMDEYYDEGYGYGFEMFSGNVYSLDSTQYAIYDSQDHSDIMFLVTLISIYLDNGNEKLSDDGHLTYYEGIKVLVDSQTGALYFIGFYYLFNPFGDSDLFSDSSNDVVEAYERIMYEQVPNMSSHTYAELLVLTIAPYLVDDWLVDSIYRVEQDDNAKYTRVGSIGDLGWDDGFVTTVETTNTDVGGDYTTFRFSFAVKSPEDVPTLEESSYVTVTTLTQFNTYETGRYEADLCIGLEDFADLIPEFNFMHSYG